MSKLQELPPDHRAVLSLLLRRRKSYAQIAAMLGIDEQAVHDRAHSALILLAPRGARELDAGRREEIGEYLLGQQAPSASATTRLLLERDPKANAWAAALHAELADLAPEALPVLPGPASSAPSAASGEAPALERRVAGPRGPGPEGRISRRGGALLLAGIAAVIVVVVVLVVSSGGKGAPSHSPTTASSQGAKGSKGSNGSKSSTSTNSTTTGSGSEPHVDSQINMTATEAGGKAVAIAYVLSEGSQRAFYLVAEHLPPTEKFFYAVWLENSSGSARPLGKTPSVSANGKLQTAGPLPTNAGSYDKILFTREENTKARTPGPLVMEGKFTLG